ncbi:MAG TPA: cellulose synthase family protein [Myxococcales bacterium]|nr:cellulose synthase family protein [Myxococcales bacterium]
MTWVELFFLATYFLVLFILSVYGSHRYVMAYLYYKYKGNLPTPKGRFQTLPRVTIQLPIFNEMYVVERLIDAVAGIEYPRDRVEIQVLDDSTDETQGIARAKVERLKRDGVAIAYIHRDNRQGYKAGALQEGLKIATGELVAVFDADFVPTKDFLRRSVHHFTDEKVGMVQVRWEHLNRDSSHLTQAQAIFLDGHFVIEHTARNRSGRFFNFNGTAGVWRRETISDAGGWQHDTLTEDLDLSYRAQLKGWQFVYLPEVVSPAEVPVEMNAFKSQQHRWAKGSIQTARKLLPRILRSDLPREVKTEAFFHLTANLTYPLMILLTILMPVSMVIRFKHGWYEVLVLDLPFFWTATMSVVVFYIASQREIGMPLWQRIKYLPFIMALGIGMCVNQSKAVIEALVGYETGFTRTPKMGLNGGRDKSWVKKRYRTLLTAQPLLELALGAYLTSAIYFALDKGVYFSLPFLLLFQWGFFYVGFVSLLQGRAAAVLRWLRRPAADAAPAVE